MINKAIKLIASTCFIFMSFQISATTINDTYIGSDDHGWGDRIGNSSYEVYSLDVSFDSDYMNVVVNTNFDQSIDRYGIEFGDLFISVDGWNPYGSAPYMNDNAATGESWEFVFDTSLGSLYGGDFSVNLSDDLINPAYTFRNGQEVQRRDGGVALDGSSVDLSNAGNGGSIEYRILLSSLGPISGSDIGLKWGMTCANDTIEGAVAYSVPEAGTLTLLALGLLGLGFIVRRKQNKS